MPHIDSHVVAFALAAGLLTMAPGPDTMLVLRNVLRGGRRAGVTTALGICSGLFVHAMLSALGLSTILTRSATVFSVVKLTGACYLAWLGLHSLSRAVSPSPPPEPLVLTTDRTDSGRCFLEGLLSNVLNPKTAMFYLAFLPQFVAPADSVFSKSLLLTAIHYGEAVIWLVGLSYLSDATQRWVLTSWMRRWLDGVCGAVLVFFGARLAFGRR